MTTEMKSEPGIIGYLLVLCIFLGLIVPALGL
jgi:hypothetical protein